MGTGDVRLIAKHLVKLPPILRLWLFKCDYKLRLS